MRKRPASSRSNPGWRAFSPPMIGLFGAHSQYPVGPIDSSAGTNVAKGGRRLMQKTHQVGRSAMPQLRQIPAVRGTAPGLRGSTHTDHSANKAVPDRLDGVSVV